MKGKFSSVLFACSMLLSSMGMGQTISFLRPTHINTDGTTAEGALRVTIGGYSQDDARYRIYNTTSQYYCWDADTNAYISSPSYPDGPRMPGTPTTSSTFWILYQRGSNGSATGKLRTRLGPGYNTGNYQTDELPTATIISNPFTISGTVTETVSYDLDTRHVILAYDAASGGNLISASPTPYSAASSTAGYSITIPTGTTIQRLEFRTVDDSLITSVTGSWASATTGVDVTLAGDTTPPTVSSVVRLTPADALTNAATVTYRVTFDEDIDDATLAVEDFTAIAVTGSNAGVSVASFDSGTANDTVVDVTVNTGSGDKTLRLDVLPAASITDIAGNDYAATFDSGEVYTVDLTAPAVSTPDLEAGSDSGALATDDITNDDTPTFSGTTEAGLTVTLFSGVTPIGSAAADGGGIYSITASTLADGVASITASATDAAGNTGTSGALSVTIDTVAPSAPTALDLAAADDSGGSNTDDVTNLTSGLTLSGIAASGTTVTLKDGASTLGSGTEAEFASGIDVVLPANVTTDVTATATDAAGNESAASVALPIQVDTLAPVSAATALVDATMIGASLAVDFTASDSGSGLDSTALFVKAPSAGSFSDTTLIPVASSFNFTAAENGRHEFYTVSTDVAGNVEATPGTADAFAIINLVANGSYTADVSTGATVSVTIPMEGGIDIQIVFTNVTVAGTITAQRNETDAAPTGIAANRLMDQWLSFTVGGGLAFDSAVVTVDYDEALLGGILESEVDRVFRDNAGTVSEITVLTVDTTLNTIEFTTPGFSDFYFGNNNAEVGSWMLLNER